MTLSAVIPAHNEEGNIRACLHELTSVLREARIAYEIIVVDDDSSDATAAVVRQVAQQDAGVSVVTSSLPGGFGRAIRAGLELVTGDVVVIYMADLSDDPRDVVAYYRKIEEGYDCVFGSRFMRGGHVEHYPPVKRVVNRIVNRTVQLLFWTRFNDLTNAFKAYRIGVVRECGPYRASHFNITLEMSLSALIRRYRIAQIPIRWYGRTWGSSNLRLREMGRKYLYVVLKVFAERMLIVDDVLTERDAAERHAAERKPPAQRRRQDEGASASDTAQH
ncbi:MAG TPA: glycosyltransferase family 2 protein [Candidatus Binatia bacterium]|nr:glycosyltransferase family 2 protein [Candidatus Binatia bacterium]